MGDPVSLARVLSDAGPWAVAIVLALVVINERKNTVEERKRGDRLESVVINVLPKLTASMNSLRWFIQGRKGPEDDEEGGR